MRDPSPVPDALPVLDAGRHRSPLEGGCVMEWASLLAGERWSDHPACTHPLLAHLARSVNDLVADDARETLVDLVPVVVGLRSADPSWSLEIALVAATLALPDARGRDARDLAVAVMTLDRLLAPTDGREVADRRPATTAALATQPAPSAWARRFTDQMGPPRHVRGLTRSVVDIAVGAGAAAPDPGLLLTGMLTAAVARCRALQERAGADVGTRQHVAVA